VRHTPGDPEAEPPEQQGADQEVGPEADQAEAVLAAPEQQGAEQPVVAAPGQPGAGPGADQAEAVVAAPEQQEADQGEPPEQVGAVVAAPGQPEAEPRVLHPEGSWAGVRHRAVREVQRPRLLSARPSRACRS